MEHALDDFASAAPKAAQHVNLYAYMVHLGRSARVDFHQGPQITWMLSGLPIVFFNQVYVERLRADEADEVIDDALAHLRSRHVVEAMWLARPGVDQEELGRYLAARGLVFEIGQANMAADLLAPGEVAAPPEALTIEVVASEEALWRWVHALNEGMGGPPEFDAPVFELLRGAGFDLPRRLYLGCLRGEPVAGSQLFLGAGVAGIYHVATVPGARRQGIGASMSLAAMRDARVLGYRIAVLNASAMGFPVYKRLGFQQVGRMNHWKWLKQEVRHGQTGL